MSKWGQCLATHVEFKNIDPKQIQSPEPIWTLEIPCWILDIFRLRSPPPQSLPSPLLKYSARAILKAEPFLPLQIFY